MKRTLLISILIWILAVNVGKIWPMSQGERYYQNLQKWYLLANKGEWEKAAKIEGKLKIEDIENFSKKNKSDELKKRLNELTVKDKKNADDWMEMGVLFYRLNRNDEAYKAISNAYQMDPIREDISKIYFTFQTFLQTQQP